MVLKKSTIGYSYNLKLIFIFLFSLLAINCSKDDSENSESPENIELIDPLLDEDSDGVINQSEDINTDGDYTNDDTDGDGIANYLDTDDDGDGVSTLNEDIDSDGNPLNDDTDSDGISNYLDIDDDGDGINTLDEDSDGDGNPMNDDSDEDGLPNYLDTEDNSPCTAESYLFTESNGIVIIEMEDVPDLDLIGDWEYRTNQINNFDSYNGSGYMYFNGANSFSVGGGSLLKYSIEITTPGTYRFLYASAIALNNDTTEHNDAWVKFPDASDFYGFCASGCDAGANSRVNPRGDGAPEPYPNGSNNNNNGFLKVYMNQLNNWWYEGKTSDHDAHNIMVTFNQPGIYTLQISGRSNGFAIDRAVLYIEQGELENLNSRTKRKDAFKGLSSEEGLCQ